MKDALENAREELKRIDHLIYVTLKYTRTVDVIKNVIERLINVFDCIIGALLKKLINEGKLENMPPSVAARIETVKKHYPEIAMMNDFMDFYLK